MQYSEKLNINFQFHFHEKDTINFLMDQNRSP